MAEGIFVHQLGRSAPRECERVFLSTVVPGLVPGIHVFLIP